MKQINARNTNNTIQTIQYKYTPVVEIDVCYKYLLSMVMLLFIIDVMFIISVDHR
jgi:hypothetical protein